MATLELQLDFYSIQQITKASSTALKIHNFSSNKHNKLFPVTQLYKSSMENEIPENAKLLIDPEIKNMKKLVYLVSMEISHFIDSKFCCFPIKMGELLFCDYKIQPWLAFSLPSSS